MTAIEPTPASAADLSARIADDIRAAIISGALIVDTRLPSEAELADQFGVSRPTLREALKRLAAQSLIRTQRGASGGAFVNRLRYEEARAQHITTSTLLLSMNAISFDTACEARFALERACTPLAAARRSTEDLDRMQAEIAHQAQQDLSDEAFCASDVAFHRALVDSAQNEVLSYQLAGAVEAMQPLMNMITYTARDRAAIIELHRRIAEAIEEHDGAAAAAGLSDLERETLRLGHAVVALRPALSGAPDKA